MGDEVNAAVFGNFVPTKVTIEMSRKTIESLPPGAPITFNGRLCTQVAATEVSITFEAGPEPPRFADEAEAIAWLEAKTADPRVDNFRVGYPDDAESIRAFGDAGRRGCRGETQEVVVIAGRFALVGCNYGH